ncbi:hypothetical protein ACFVVA_19480 [Kitasatospora sp. NPDC058048]|uniref:hypothetical protein n=1 Tax=Kitasatospora sp. NPDC058048 TaxID=3346313 RepID=UPI0036D79372
MRLIELERITARSYAGAPGRVTVVPIDERAVMAPRAIGETVWYELSEDILAGLRGAPTAYPPSVVKDSGAPASLMMLSNAVHRVVDLVVVDGQHRSSSVSTLLEPGRWRRVPLTFLGALHDYALHGIHPATTYSDAAVPWVVEAKAYSSALAVLQSGYELAAALEARRIPLREVAPTTLRLDAEGLPEPLAIACGITRLRRPLIPRAPGRTGAASRFGVGVCELDVSLAA